MIPGAQALPPLPKLANSSMMEFVTRTPRNKSDEQAPSFLDQPDDEIFDEDLEIEQRRFEAEDERVLNTPFQKIDFMDLDFQKAVNDAIIASSFWWRWTRTTY